MLSINIVKFEGFSGSYARQQEVMQRLQTECGNTLPFFHPVPLENLKRQAQEDKKLMFILVIGSEISNDLHRFVHTSCIHLFLFYSCHSLIFVTIEYLMRLVRLA